MRKGIKILGKVLSAAVLLLIILPLALSLLLDIPAVQNYVVQKAVRMASKKLETTVSIDRVDIGLFSRVKIKGFYVEDYSATRCSTWAVSTPSSPDWASSAGVFR